MGSCCTIQETYLKEPCCGVRNMPYVSVAQNTPRQPTVGTERKTYDHVAYPRRVPVSKKRKNDATLSSSPSAAPAPVGVLVVIVVVLGIVLALGISFAFALSLVLASPSCWHRRRWHALLVHQGPSPRTR